MELSQSHDWLAEPYLSYGRSHAELQLRVIDACVRRDYAEVARLLNTFDAHATVHRVIDINAPVCCGVPFISLAALHDDLELVNVLLTAGARYDHKLGLENHPMRIACLHGNAAIISALFATKDLCLCDMIGDGVSYLRIACESGSIDAVRAIIANPAFYTSILEFAEEYEMTPLMTACKHGFANIARLLLEFGANPNFVTSRYIFPLYIAVVYWNDEIIDMLLAAGAIVNHTRPIDAMCAFRRACRYNKAALIKRFIDAGCDMNQASNEEFSPFEIACHARNIAIVRMMRDAGGDVAKLSDDAREWFKSIDYKK